MKDEKCRFRCVVDVVMHRGTSMPYAHMHTYTHITSPIDSVGGHMLISKAKPCMSNTGDISIKYLPYQLSMVVYVPTMGSTPEREPEKRLPLPRKAAGAQITHSQQEEVVTKNNETVLIEAGYRNGYNLNLLTRTYERASLVPAAAVTPALKVYIVIAAVKKLVVGIPRLGASCASEDAVLFICLQTIVFFIIVSKISDPFTIESLENRVTGGSPAATRIFDIIAGLLSPKTKN
ncbi:unnamed protein product [Dracunculus medinensis]|uniref:Transmembrane protein n=1 Tax=Dracunculus medinensis TaxID=318479 RepID=A0A0N4UKS6_DRAME|nr:unnamed protein product [Dracunculus medinensis]